MNHKYHLHLRGVAPLPDGVFLLWTKKSMINAREIIVAKLKLIAYNISRRKSVENRLLKIKQSFSYDSTVGRRCYLFLLS